MGPLAEVTVLEVGGIGPTPFCGMLLADIGAEVIRVERRAGRDGETPPRDPLQRSRRSVAIDLKAPAGAETLLTLYERADVLIRGRCHPRPR